MGDLLIGGIPGFFALYVSDFVRGAHLTSTIISSTIEKRNAIYAGEDGTEWES